MATDSIRRVLLHGGTDEGFDSSVRFARRLVETFGAELHVVYTVDEPLSAGWTAEIAAAKLPESCAAQFTVRSSRFEDRGSRIEDRGSWNCEP